MADLAAWRLIDPLEAAAIGSEAHLVRIARYVGAKFVCKATGQNRAVDDHAHFGVEAVRARIEVERADENPAAVDRKRLGMQPRRRAVADSAVCCTVTGCVARCIRL